MGDESLKTLLFDVVLHAANHFVSGCDSVPVIEIIPSSVWSKFGGSCIIHAGGGGGFWHSRAGCSDAQPFSARIDITTQIVNGLFSIGQFLRVFGIQCSDIALTGLHVFDGVVSQAETFGGFVALVFVGDGVVAVMINSP